MLLYIMYIMLAYFILFAALFNAVCLHDGYFLPLTLANAFCFHALNCVEHIGRMVRTLVS